MHTPQTLPLPLLLLWFPDFSQNVTTSRRKSAGLSCSSHWNPENKNAQCHVIKQHSKVSGALLAGSSIKNTVTLVAQYTYLSKRQTWETKQQDCVKSARHKVFPFPVRWWEWICEWFRSSKLHAHLLYWSNPVHNWLVHDKPGYPQRVGWQCQAAWRWSSEADGWTWSRVYPWCSTCKNYYIFSHEQAPSLILDMAQIMGWDFFFFFFFCAIL